MEDDKQKGGEDFQDDLSHIEPELNDDALFASANILVDDFGYSFNDIVAHHGVSPERLNRAIAKNVEKKSEEIQKAYDSGYLDDENFLAEIEKIQHFSKKVNE